MRSVAVDDETRVAEARRIATGYAQSIGFSEVEVGRVAIVVTELATNLLKHASGGELVMSHFDDGDGPGVECLALDRGPGIANLSAAMRDGHSTAGSPGTGLGAIRRQSHVLDIYSTAANGAAVMARMQRGDPAAFRAFRPTRCGAINLPMRGEEACGDAFAVRLDADGLTVMVVDGLGHGPMAASASHAAIKVFEGQRGEPTSEFLNRLHVALRSTRGAAASIARLDADDESVTFAGVGNVAGVLMSAGETRRMVAYNGTLGHALRAVRPFQYAAHGETLVGLASDGLSTSWSLDSYPGLQHRHPSLIAGVLYRDFCRRTDDVTVLVARRLAS